MTKKQTRREFLQKGSAATAAAAAGGVATMPRSFSIGRPGGALNEIRIGVVGTGGRGGGACNDNLKINENVRLIAMADLETDKCKRLREGLKKGHDTKVDVSDDHIFGGLDGYKKVIHHPDVDLVILTTSPGFRPSHILEAVNAKKHVFAEKPVCVDPAGYRQCITAHELAVKQGTAIVTGTQYRRQESYVEAINRIHDGIIGDVVAATARYCSSGIWYRERKPEMTDLQYQIHNWMHFIWLSGDQIAEQAVHNIDCMNWVMGGSPLSAFGSGGRFTRPKDSQMWDSMSIDYEYPDNKLVSFSCRQIPGTKGDAHNVVYCTDGVAYIKAINGGSRIVDKKGNELFMIKGNIGAAYRQEHNDLVLSIRQGRPIVELKQTADSSLTAVLGRMAAYTGQRVTWDFATKESKLDLMPKNLSMDMELKPEQHAVPGRTKLI